MAVLTLLLLLLPLKQIAFFEDYDSKYLQILIISKVPIAQSFLYGKAINFPSNILLTLDMPDQIGAL